MNYRLRAPMHVVLPRKTKKDKKIPINLNWYRNAQHFESNTVKKLYKQLLQKQIEQLPIFTKICVELTIYPPTKRRLDIGNVGSITEKFFLDALVELGKLEDDSYLFVLKTTTTFGSIDKNDPRVEILIKEI